MTLSEPQSTLVRKAMESVATRALIAQSQPDLEAMRLALGDVSHAIIRAAQILRDAEVEARREAIRRVA